MSVIFHSCHPKGSWVSPCTLGRTWAIASFRAELNASFFSVSFAFCSLSPMAVKSVNVSAIFPPYSPGASQTRHHRTRFLLSEREGGVTSCTPQRKKWFRKNWPIGHRGHGWHWPIVTELGWSTAYYERESQSTVVLTSVREGLPKCGQCCIILTFH